MLDQTPIHRQIYVDNKGKRDNTRHLLSIAAVVGSVSFFPLIDAMPSSSYIGPHGIISTLKLIYLSLSITICLLLYSKRIVPLWRLTSFRAVLIYLSGIAVSTVFALDLSSTISSLKVISGGIALFVIFAISPSSKKDIEILLWVLVMVSLSFCLASVINYSNMVPMHRLKLGVNDWNTIGSQTAIIVSICLYLFESNPALNRRIFLGISITLFVYIISLTRSRQAFGILLFGIGSMTLTGMRKRKLFYLLLFITLLGMILMTMGPIFERILQILPWQISYNYYPANPDLSVKTRINEFIVAREYFIKSPVIGHGVIQTMPFYSVGFHNAFLFILVSSGLFGFMAFSIFLTIIGVSCTKTRSRLKELENEFKYKRMGDLIIILFFEWVFLLFFTWTNYSFWICMGIVVAWVRIVNNRLRGIL